MPVDEQQARLVLLVLLVLQRGERAEHHRAVTAEHHGEAAAVTRGAHRPGDPPDHGDQGILGEQAGRAAPGIRTGSARSPRL